MSRGSFNFLQISPSSQEKKKNMSKKMPSLPFDLVEDILCRLSVKPLKRFRCVAKSWCFLIDSEEFIKSHWKRSAETNSHRHLIVGGKKVFAVDLDNDPIKASVIKLPFAQNVDISNSCNGLFLVLAQPLILIWNPFTREDKVLPGIHDIYPPPMGCYMKIVYGFAYDSRNDDYKVMRVVERRELMFQTWMSSLAHIYSLKVQFLEENGKFYLSSAALHEKLACSVKGPLHTLIEYTPPELPGPNKIMAFSIENEMHYEVMLPAGIEATKDMHLSLNKIGRCLSVNCASESGTEIWVMKDYGMRESWTKSFTIDIRLDMDNLEDCESMKPVLYSKDGHKVLVYLGHNSCFWHDVRNKTAENVPVKGLPMKLDYVEACSRAWCSFIANKSRNRCLKEEEKKIRKKRNGFLSTGFKLVL